MRLPQRLKIVSSVIASSGNPLITNQSFTPSPSGEKPPGMNSVTVGADDSDGRTSTVGTLSSASFQMRFPLVSGLLPLFDISLTGNDEVELTALPSALFEITVTVSGTTLMLNTIFCISPGFSLLPEAT